MCGIVGYIGNKKAYPILIKGLKRLEYRGYDSAGVAMLEEGDLQVYKCKGKVSDLENHADGKPQDANIGIGHTRWATHGEPNDTNAHPHQSGKRDLAIIHNGISYIDIDPFHQRFGFHRIDIHKINSSFLSYDKLDRVTSWKCKSRTTIKLKRGVFICFKIIDLE